MEMFHYKETIISRTQNSESESQNSDFFVFSGCSKTKLLKISSGQPILYLLVCGFSLGLNRFDLRTILLCYDYSYGKVCR